MAMAIVTASRSAVAILVAILASAIPAVSAAALSTAALPSWECLPHQMHEMMSVRSRQPACLCWDRAPYAQHQQTAQQPEREDVESL